MGSVQRRRESMDLKLLESRVCLHQHEDLLKQNFVLGRWKWTCLENRLVPEGRYSETSSSVITERLQCLREMMERETVQTESTRKKVGNVKESVKVKINHSILCNQWTTVVMWSLFSGELLRTKIISEMLFWKEISSVLKPCCQTPESVWTRTSQTRQRATWRCDNSYTENSQSVV